MVKQKYTDTNLEYLIRMLASKNGTTRQNARHSLVAIGKPVISALTETLTNSKVDHIRWEAVKTIGAIGDASAIPALVQALEDTDPDVAWLAIEALRKLETAAWPVLLRIVIKRGKEDVLMRQRISHVFRNQEEEGYNDLLAALRKSLKSGTVPATAAVAAYDILKRMKSKP
ncbi:MAG: HEAT repeat domain-containing protein [Ignavibacteriae bacterium]|nr:MAG: HEAT repeat domain-containing protein [Ignavibacteriota bacterium]